MFVTMAKVNNMIRAAAPEDLFLIIELKKRLARIGIRRPNSQLGPALRVTTGRDNLYQHRGALLRTLVFYFHTNALSVSELFSLKALS